MITYSNDEQLKQFIEEKLAVREEYYQKANLICDNKNISVETVIGLIQ